jgi:phytoene dehydrogenase-like protein
LSDKLRVLTVRRRACSGSIESLFARPQKTTIRYLREAGFSDGMINRFFVPFLRGIFLEPELTTSSAVFEFVFRMFSLGEAALPARGIGAMAQQLASRIPRESVRVSSPVREIKTTGVVLDNGTHISADAVVVATDALSAARLRGDDAPEPGGAVTCLYFAAPQAPVDEPILVLNGTGEGPVNNLCVPSQVAPVYAPSGNALVSASVIGIPGSDDAELEAAVRTQLGTWFGEAVRRWHLLRIYRIHDALPAQQTDVLQDLPRDPRLGTGVYICGDHCVAGSLQAALLSGRRAATAVLNDL